MRKRKKKGEVTAVRPSHYMGLSGAVPDHRESGISDSLKKAVMLRDSVKEGMDDNQDRLYHAEGS